MPNTWVVRTLDGYEVELCRTETPEAAERFADEYAATHNVALEDIEILPLEEHEKELEGSLVR